jgi:hypothetical protein
LLLHEKRGHWEKFPASQIFYNYLTERGQPVPLVRPCSDREVQLFKKRSRVFPGGGVLEEVV